MTPRNLRPLMALYDRNAKDVARHPDGRVWIDLADGLSLVHPWRGDWNAFPMTPERVQVVSSYFAHPRPDDYCLVSLDRLTFWALRRGADRYLPCERCGVWQERPDAQLVLGRYASRRVFDRNLIRASLQWLHQTCVPIKERVELAIDDHPIGAMLRMSCGEWQAYVMSMVHTKPGDDPLQAD